MSGMLNVSALITGYEAVGDHTEFIIQISCNGGLWLISRRFSDFDQLHARLTRCFGDLIEARLPEKQWFGRFDPNFLAKRQAKLQEYLELLFQVPGILEDRSLLHFLELEKHLDLHGDLLMGGIGSGPSSNLASAKSGLMNENDRLSAIVENAAQAFIDISEVPEPLEPDQAMQRKQEIVTAAQSLVYEQKLIDQFTTSLKVLNLPAAPAWSNEHIMAKLESANEDDMSYEQEHELLQQTLEQLQDSWRCRIVAPSEDLLAIIDNSMLLNGSSANDNASGSGSTDQDDTNGPSSASS